MERNATRFRPLPPRTCRVGKLSALVGTFGHLGPKQEEKSPAGASVSSQRSSPRKSFSATATAAYITTLAIIGQHPRQGLPLKSATCSAPKVARRRSTSAKSQKRLLGHAAQEKPDFTSEQISGLARGPSPAIAQAAMENIPLWHERRHLSFVRRARHLPDSTTLVDYLLAKNHRPHRPATGLPRADEEESRIHRRPSSFRGNCCSILPKRECCARTPTTSSSPHAMRAWKDDLSFREEVARDPKIAKLLGPRGSPAPSTIRANSPMSTQSSSACLEADIGRRECPMPAEKSRKLEARS